MASLAGIAVLAALGAYREETGEALERQRELAEQGFRLATAATVRAGFFNLRSNEVHKFTTCDKTAEVLLLKLVVAP